jgi:hypothetical protein
MAKIKNSLLTALNATRLPAKPYENCEVCKDNYDNNRDGLGLKQKALDAGGKAQEWFKPAKYQTDKGKICIMHLRKFGEEILAKQAEESAKNKPAEQSSQAA